MHPDTNAGLLARGYASLTALVGVREAGSEADDVLDSALEALYAVPGVTPEQDRRSTLRLSERTDDLNEPPRPEHPGTLATVLVKNVRPAPVGAS